MQLNQHIAHQISCLILIGILLSTIFIPTGESTLKHPITLYVDDDNTEGPWLGTVEAPYQYITDALHNAQQNDCIFVKQGIYREQLLINKSITIQGEHPEKTILDGTTHKYVLRICAPQVHIQNLTFQNTTGSSCHAALSITSDTVFLSHLIIRNAKTGLSIFNASHHKIHNCSIHNNGIGIRLQHTNTTHLTACTLAHNAHALVAEHAENIHLTRSYFHTNGRSAVFIKTTTSTITHCNISDNSVNLGGILLDHTTHVLLKENNLHHNGQAITLKNAHHITIHKNQLTRNTHFALWINQHSSNITITQNNITNNYRYALYIQKTSHCTLQQNNIVNTSLYAIYNHNSYCDARNNYWGTPNGPSITDFRPGRRITPLIGRTRYFPWNIRPITSAGPHWKHNTADMQHPTSYPFQNPLNLPGADQDADHAPDWWEQKWNYPPDKWNNHRQLDPDCDGLNNLEECYTDPYGSNPYHKDIFVEIDWMNPKKNDTSNKPAPHLINRTYTFFAQHNITLHIDTGTLGGGEQIPYATNFSFHKLQEYYWEYFLHQNTTNPRKGIFHYGIICDYGPDVNFPYIGWNQFDSFLISAEWLQQLMPRRPRENIIMGALLHQLGHHLRLLADTHPGIDNMGTLTPFTLQWFTYKNYQSNMNYRYKYTIFTYSDGTHGRGDFNDWNHIDLSFFKNTSFKPKEEKQSYINDHIYSAPTR